MIEWQLEDGLPVRVRATTGGHLARWAAVLEDWQIGGGSALGRCLRGCAFSAAYFECEALTRSRLDQPFQAVLLPAPTLARMPSDHRPFQQLFASIDADPVIAFDSLGKDARLIAPRPDGRDYGHLMSFLRDANDELVDELFRRVAREVSVAIADPPRWISTSGLGVAWLHVRIDSRPKYYQYGPFRTPPA